MESIKEKFLKQLDIVLKLFGGYEDEHPDDRIKRILDQWTPSTDDLDSMADDEQSTATRERVRQAVFAYIHPQRRPLRVVWNAYSKYAAVAAIFLLLIGFSYWGLRSESAFRQQYLSWSVEPALLLQTTTGELDSIRLTDGTLVYLNRDSRLSYKAGAFNKDNREVWLSGEAFFEVAKNPDKPFIIHSSNGIETKVLGTSFNVKAYDELSQQVISVSTGTVQVSNEDGESVRITPDQKAVFDKRTNTLVTGLTNSNLANSWRNGNVVFDRADREEIALRIHQYFGKEALFRNNALNKTHFIASYPASTTLDEIVRTIALTNDVTYIITDNMVIFK